MAGFALLRNDALGFLLLYSAARSDKKLGTCSVLADGHTLPAKSITGTERKVIEGSCGLSTKC